jgi:hypothetical protein
MNKKSSKNTRHQHIARSQYVNDKVGTNRFNIRIETDEDSIEHLYPVRKMHNEAERALFAEYDEINK